MTWEGGGHLCDVDVAQCGERVQRRHRQAGGGSPGQRLGQHRARAPLDALRGIRCNGIGGLEGLSDGRETHLLSSGVGLEGLLDAL